MLELVLALVTFPALPAAGELQEGVLAELGTAFADGDLGRALELTATVGDRGLAAEWRFHILYNGGDQAGALSSVRDALRESPDHPSLLENGTVCALGLGLSDLADEYSQRLQEAPLEEAARARAADLRARALELRERDRAARAGAVLARWVTGILALLAAGALGWLARSPAN